MLSSVWLEDEDKDEDWRSKDEDDRFEDKDKKLKIVPRGSSKTRIFLENNYTGVWIVLVTVCRELNKLPMSRLVGVIGMKYEHALRWTLEVIKC